MLKRGKCSFLIIFLQPELFYYDGIIHIDFETAMINALKKNFPREFTNQVDSNRGRGLPKVFISLYTHIVVPMTI